MIGVENISLDWITETLSAFYGSFFMTIVIVGLVAFLWLRSFGFTALGVIVALLFVALGILITMERDQREISPSLYMVLSKMMKGDSSIFITHKNFFSDKKITNTEFEAIKKHFLAPHQPTDTKLLSFKKNIFKGI